VIEKGQTLVNPVTGERMTFVETAAENGGERVVIELHADPGGSVAAAHVHPSQWETFSVVSGKTNAKGMPNPFRLAVIATRTSTPCSFQ
jgi:hypothetical protein